jgi:hypothetical protein
MPAQRLMFIPAALFFCSLEATIPATTRTTP